MTDLLDQLHAYGRQIEADGLIGTRPNTVARRSGADPGRAQAESVQVAPLTPNSADSAPTPLRRSFRSASVLVAAVAASVLVVTSAPFLPSAGLEGGAMDKRSGLALSVCLFVAGCSSGADSAGTATSSVTDPPTSSATSAGAPTSAGGPPGLPLGDDVPVEPGVYVISDMGPPIQVTVPSGWTAVFGSVLHGPDGGTLAIINGPWDVYTDACNWVDARADVGSSVNDLVTALVAQEPTTNTPPLDVTIDGYTGTEIVLSAPPALDFTTCYAGTYATMVNDGRIQSYVEAPDEPVALSILDLNGERVIITHWSSAATSDATKAQLAAMVDSIKVG